MARDLYQNTMAVADATGTLKALAGIQVFVYTQGTQVTVPIYSARTGASQKSNPIVTDATGLVEFYADMGEYDIRSKDTNVTPRIADRTVQWNSTSGADGGIPTGKLAGDAGLALTSLAADILRQVTPIGQVIEWWRPDDTFPVPAGFEICDGRTITAANHDFGTGSSITLPDLRNTFILGADAAKSGAASGTNGNTSAEAPGIRGAGGSNAVLNLAHTHTIPDHTHSGTTGSNGFLDHFHTGTTNVENSSLSHGHAMPLWAPGRNGGNGWGYVDSTNLGTGGGSTVTPAFSLGTAPKVADVSAVSSGGPPAHTHNFSTTGPSNGLIHTHAVTVGSGSDASTNPATSSGLSATTDHRPRYVGLLRLMKVKRS